MERTDMDEIELGALKKLEIVVEGEHREFVTDLLDHAGVKGYTIVENLSAAVVLFEQSDSDLFAANAGPKVGRNEPCPCGSGKKYKHCHGRLA